MIDIGEILIRFGLGVLGLMASTIAWYAFVLWVLP